ncbi:hypothetical protein MSAN_02127200 [Mycena sanguinolenta]|uniref:Uncharacterized protein n=1 Tax=Mycena sanguinolenta TaxID=230812 RepID=A0A8H7CLP3_9AGAR|nr:hypothetical protein MSAN_02127200 [Mycena sanguinolenta]
MKSLAIFCTLLAARFVAAQSPVHCTLMGNVSLYWGTTEETPATATPLGWSTSATAPTDATGHGLLAVRSTVSPTLWGAFSCVGSLTRRANGGTSSGPPGGTGGGNGNGNGNGGGTGGTGGTGVTPPATTQVNMFGAIADQGSNLCLTASALQFGNITVTRASCINALNTTPWFSQAWQWTMTEVNGVIVAGNLSSLVFMGTENQAALPLNTLTDYVPSLVGSGVGAYVAFDEVVGGVNPAEAGFVPGLVVNFADLV